tara:strand:- start:1074 stop:1448 length:375 start_codon:yes stop_codon:yes gene_type:complete
VTPIKIKINKKTGSLSLEYQEDENFLLTGEYLRVHSPSAEVKGHGKGQEILQDGKKFVKICSVESVGNYALKLIFSDSHDSGIYTWSYLYDLAIHQKKYWDIYLKKLSDSGKYRDPSLQALRIT